MTDEGPPGNTDSEADLDLEDFNGSELMENLCEAERPFE